MQAITIEIPEEIFENYQTTEALRQAIYEDVVANEYQKGNISIRQGAKMLGITYEEFMVDFLGEREISFINGTPSELETEFQQEDVWLDEVLGNKT
jgi:predicted HTH domain antitoxin